jgi:hypothetical protein
MEDLKKYKILNLTAETCKEYLDNTWKQKAQRQNNALIRVRY